MAWRAQDKFDRADSQALGGFWQENPADPNAHQILTNRLLIDNPAIGGVNSEIARYNDPGVGNDQSSEARITDLDANSFGAVGVRIFFDAGLARWRGYYFARVDFLNGNENQRIIVDNDMSSILAARTVAIANNPEAWAVGRTVKISVQGTTVRAFVGGVQALSVVDAGFPAGKPGFGAPGGINGSVTGFDDWLGTDLGSGGSLKRNRMGMAIAGGRRRLPGEPIGIESR